MNLSSGFCVVVSALAVTCAVQAAPKVPEFLPAVELTGHEGLITEISSDGKVVAGTTVENGMPMPFRHSAKDGYRVVALATDLPETATSASLTGLSDDGSTAYGHFQYSEAGVTRHEGFVWTKKGGFQRVGLVEDGNYTVMRAITKNGKVLGGQYIVDGEPAAFVWTPAEGIRPCAEVYPGFPAEVSSPLWISNNQKVVWATGFGNGATTMRWTRDQGMMKYYDLPGGDDSLEAYAVTGDGRLAVGAGRTLKGYEAVLLLENGTADPLFPDANFQSVAQGVTPGGRLVYGVIDGNRSTTNFQAQNAFFLDRKTGTEVRLSDILERYAPEVAEEWSGVSLSRVSDNGDVIVGSGVYQGKFSSWVMRNVAKVLMPKPSKLAR